MHSITRSEMKGITSALCVALRISGKERSALMNVAKTVKSVGVGSFIDCPVGKAGLQDINKGALSEYAPELMHFAVGFDAYIDNRFDVDRDEAFFYEIEVTDA